MRWTTLFTDKSNLSDQHRAHSGYEVKDKLCREYSGEVRFDNAFYRIFLPLSFILSPNENLIQVAISPENSSNHYNRGWLAMSSVPIT